jgi:molecular chaperone GrpE
MSQKDESKSQKWRQIAEESENAAESMADDEHLLPEDDSFKLDETSRNKLIDQINLLEKQVDFYKDQTARAQAEVENMRRRMEQEVSKARKFGVEKLISDMIPVADSMVRGLEGVVSNDPAIKTLRHGMELTLDIMNKLLEKNGVTVIDPAAGDAFDPAQHEAMSMRAEQGMEHNTILQVLQKGYSLHGRVIRAAMVIVAA